MKDFPVLSIELSISESYTERMVLLKYLKM